jgi:RNA 2',3'-cyclic 3'-phosphodiesterase
MIGRGGIMRAFFCLPLENDVRAVLGRAADRLRRETRMAASWVDSANYHVTLRFLGDIDPQSTVDLKDLATRAARDCPPFALRLRSIGAFPTLDRARVLWVGGETSDGFRRLAEFLERGLIELGFPGEPKPAVAHVTIARLKGAADPRLGSLVASLGTLPTRECVPRAIVLMESELSPRGPQYTPLFSVPIAGREEP